LGNAGPKNNRGACTGGGRCGEFSGEHLTPITYKTFAPDSGEITSCARYANCYPGKSLRLPPPDSWKLIECKVHNA